MNSGLFDGMDQWDKSYALYLLLMLIIVMISSTALRGQGLRRLLGMSLAWVSIFTAILLAYSYREESRALYARVRGEIDPAHGVAVADGYRLRARSDGHFWVRATVDDMPVLFLVDTGASDIVLSDATARRIGIDTARLNHDRIAMTANGAVRSAAIRLKRIEIGPIIRRDMPASVTQGPLDVNLLGMHYLNSLSSWRVEGDMLILKP